MARTPMTPTARIAKVIVANDQLSAAIAAATAAGGDPNTTRVEREQLWEVVEELGATIHRQSRILAGKSRGG